MKQKRKQLALIIVTFGFLIALVIIQVNWILNAASIQESQFSHSVNLTLNRIVENISRDKQMCKNVENCFITVDSTPCCLRTRYYNEWLKVDSIIKNNLEYYNIDLEYEFEIVDSENDSIISIINQPYYSQSLEKALQQSGIQLKINFPERKEFILAQIGTMFITSILLIILIMISLIVIINYYIKEKKIAENTKDFINNMTHEFKTPLANIALANNMISKNKDVSSSEKLKKYTSIINFEQEKLQDHVEGLLYSASLENRSNDNNEVIDVCSLLQKAEKSFEVQIAQKQGDIIINECDSQCYTFGDKKHLLTAFSNIIDNAIKYSSKAPKITIDSLIKNKIIFIRIRDNGIGIAKEHQKEIFEKFYRIPTGDLHNIKGFGLGLSFVKNVIDSFGGKVNVSSLKGKGSVFEIQLPLFSE
ncbi:MAG: HAMP domain-containing histidine kinase [Bacteroidales bacterium]|nr:HAMP domain-containing histidine kinase [Bacteroidales bacterium]